MELYSNTIQTKTQVIYVGDVIVKWTVMAMLSFTTHLMYQEVLIRQLLNIG